MQVNSISNVSFAGNEKKTNSKQKRNDYFKCISQANANEALKMSVGREVTDGKLKFAKEATKLAGLLGLGLTNLGMLNIGAKIAKSVKQIQSPEEILPIVEKYSKPTSLVIGIGSAVSAALLIASKAIGFTNEAIANATAEKRGFIKPFTHFKSKEEAYKATENVYSTYVKK